MEAPGGGATRALGGDPARAHDLGMARAALAREGPIERHPWPEHLEGRVSEGGARPRLRGYDVEEDLARHYAPQALLALAFSSELPDAAAERGLAVALGFLAAVDVAEAPGHAAHLARLSGATDAGLVGVAAVALVEQARFEVERHRRWLSWLERREGPPPAEALSATDEERQSVARLLEALEETGLDAGFLRLPGEARPGRTAAVLAALARFGLASDAAMVTAWVVARLGGAVAEGLSATPLAFRSYPMHVPAFRYTPGGGP